MQTASHVLSRPAVDLPNGCFRIPGEGLDLAGTLDSGQVFHWQLSPCGAWYGAIGDLAVWIRPDPAGDSLICPAHLEGAARDYFRLDGSHARMVSTFPVDDPFLAEAMGFCPGLRMIRQPVWECLATFITSSLKQVAHIRQISLKLRQRFGERHDLDGFTMFAYPTPERLAEAGESALRECGLGYRARSLHRAALRLTSGEASFADLEGLSDAEARNWLLEFYGVGEKIANCVLLFGCGRLGAFPIDVWIERVLRSRYFPRARKPLPLPKLQKFAEQHFGPYAGCAQQYLFHYARKTFTK